MQRLKDAGLDPSNPNFSADPSAPGQTDVMDGLKAEAQAVQMTKPYNKSKISITELGSPEAKEHAWFVVRGEVYMGSGFFNDHPGGAQSIILVAGEDATEDFMAIHSSHARKQLADFHIGTLEGTVEAKADDDDESSSGSFLSSKKWKKVILVNVKDVSGDAKIYRFALEGEEQELGLPFGQHVYVRLRRKVVGTKVDEGELIQRAYTPLSERGARGFIDMLIKIYHPTTAFPLGGRMTLGFSELVAGDTVELKGPVGHFIWKGKGTASIHGEEKHVSEIGLVCGGSGITPIRQVLRGILTDTSDNETKVWVVDVNRRFEDILCREELDALTSEHPERFRLHHSLTGKDLPENWAYSVGRITREMLTTHLPTPGDDKLVCICGPAPMEQSVKAFLGEIGWDSSNQIVLF